MVFLPLRPSIVFMELRVASAARIELALRTSHPVVLQTPSSILLCSPSQKFSYLCSCELLFLGRGLGRESGLGLGRGRGLGRGLDCRDGCPLCPVHHPCLLHRGCRWLLHHLPPSYTICPRERHLCIVSTIYRLIKKKSILKRVPPTPMHSYCRRDDVRTKLSMHCSFVASWLHAVLPPRSLHLWMR